jgi:hypothetical protein
MRQACVIETHRRAYRQKFLQSYRKAMGTTTEDGGTIATDVSPVCSGSLSRTEATPAWPHVPLRLVGVLWE